MAKYKRFDVDTTLWFGKHKGYQVQALVKRDPAYLVWMYDEFEDAEWTDDAEDLVAEAEDRIPEIFPRGRGRS